MEIIVTKDEKGSPILKLNSSFLLQILTLLGLFLFVNVDMPCHSIKLSHIMTYGTFLWLNEEPIVSTVSLFSGSHRQVLKLIKGVFHKAILLPLFRHRVIRVGSEGWELCESHRHASLFYTSIYGVPTLPPNVWVDSYVLISGTKLKITNSAFCGCLYLNWNFLKPYCKTPKTVKYLFNMYVPFLPVWHWLQTLCNK